MKTTKTALILYSSNTGNTEKVAQAIRSGLEDAGVQVTFKKPEAAADVDYFNFDLVCVGSPAIQWHPTKQMDDFLKSKMNEYRKQGKIKPCAPKVAGKNLLVFVTYTGPHTGLDEATPAGKYMAQFFAHVGFNIIDEWYILGEFHGNEANSTQGRMGDVRGKPTAEELQKIKEGAKALASTL
ncbi:MAG: flavodoxin domain-containing protein [Candidatus Bathyarchaeota archaeon]|nr:flavodoxin domain-containing protein [Candidatus Bathyarchaeota archaeon]